MTVLVIIIILILIGWSGSLHVRRLCHYETEFWESMNIREWT